MGRSGVADRTTRALPAVAVGEPGDEVVVVLLLLLLELPFLVKLRVGLEELCSAFGSFSFVGDRENLSDDPRESVS